MSNTPYRILPHSASGRIVAFGSYLVAVFSGLCAYIYASAPYACSDSERQSLVTKSLILCVVHGVLAIGFSAAGIALSRHDTTRYKLYLSLALSGVALGELVLMIGYGFAVGTVCSS